MACGAHMLRKALLSLPLLGVLWLIGAVSTRASDSLPVPVRTIHVPDDPRALPFRLSADASTAHNPPAWGTHWLADIDGDGTAESCNWYCEIVDQGLFRSAVITNADDDSKGRTVQYNGPLMNCRIWGHTMMDVVGSPAPDVVLQKHRGDTAFLEIVAFTSANGSCAIDTAVIVPAAVGWGLSPGQSWHALHIDPVTAVDINGDGYRDLIYSRVAKPDSAFERGLLAWDIHNERQLWFYPTADAIGPGCHAVFSFDDTAACLIVSIRSTCNRYESNGMTSHQAYAVGLDLEGHELWRHTIGGAFFSPLLCAFDVDGDGREEACVLHGPDYPSATSDTILCAYDPHTGVLKAALVSPFSGAPLLAAQLTRAAGRDTSLYVQMMSGDPERLIFRVGHNLACAAVFLSDITLIGTAVDLIGGDEPQLVGFTPAGRLVLLDMNLKPLATFGTEGTASIGATARGPRLCVSKGYQNFTILSASPQSALVQIYARYSVWLQILAAAVLMAVIWKGATVVWHWRQTAMGLPTLDRVGAMVMLLDRKGRVVFVNAHALSTRLLGAGRCRREHYRKTGLASIPEIVSLLDQAFAEPLGVQQQRIEVHDNGVSSHLEVVVYPHVDARNAYLGKIVVVEDMADRRQWQWRLVLGDAAQKWVHRIKHHVATTRMYLGNVSDDPAIASRLAESEDLREQWQGADRQIMECGEAAAKILKYLRNTKPQLTDCNLNELASLAVDATGSALPIEITVSFLPQPDLPNLPLDPDQMREVLDNLLSNAVRAVGEKGTITIHTRLADGLLAGAKGRTAELVVEDTGVGIAPEDLARVSEPGFSRAAGGTGIGLALVREIVENHGGEVRMESTPGVGTRLTVRLPVAET